MAELTREDVRRLAAAYEPALYFSDGEKWFPIQAESWLSHASGADWVRSDGLDIASEDPNAAHGRGTALIGADGTRLSAAPTPAGEALGPAEVALLASASEDAYLTFGGWKDGTELAGDTAYVYDAFSEYAAAMDPHNVAAAFERDRPNRPVVWHAHPTTPTVYCEVDAPRLHTGVATGDAPLLDPFLSLTYHYLFPVREEPVWPFGQGVAEGQWVAATVYLVGVDAQVPAGAQRPVFRYGKDVLDGFRPHGVVLSRPDGQSPACRAWEATYRLGTHPMIAVAKLSHELLFAPTGPTIGTPFDRDLRADMDTGAAGAAPHTRLGTEDPGRDNGPFNDFWTTAAFVVGLLIASPALIVAAVLARLFGTTNDRHSGDDPGEQTPLMPLPRADAGGAVARPADGTATPGTVVVPHPDSEPWTAYRVDDPAFTILRVVDRFHPVAPGWWAADESGTPPPVTETPAWWEYRGRWGVMTKACFAWGPGTRRTPLAARNTVALTLAWALPSTRAPRRPRQG